MWGRDEPLPSLPRVPMHEVLEEVRVQGKAILRGIGICKAFPGVQALDDVSFEACLGEIHGLVGENGAGKTTLAHVLTGAYSKDAGRILFDGQEVEIKTPDEAAQLGIAIVHQEAALAFGLSVAENIFLGHMPSSWAGFVKRKEMEQAASSLLNSMGEVLDVHEKVEKLTVSERQILEITKVLSLQAKVVFMDEPTSSLSGREKERLFMLIQRLKADGIGIVFVSHRLEEVLQVCDRITVLRDGKVIDTVRTSDTNVEGLIRMMVGRSVRIPVRRERQSGSTVALEVKGMQEKGSRERISFILHEGEVLGFAGLVGAGRTEMASVVFGASPSVGGEILIGGKRVEISSPRDALRNGIAMVPEDRKQHGLFMGLSVCGNISIAVLRRLARLGLVERARETGLVSDYVQRLAIRTPSLEQAIGKLSGGNQQKAVIARWLAVKPRVLILDEPTQGIDVGAKAEIYQIIMDLALQGMGIIMISSDLPELLAICDRIVVMRDRKIASEHVVTDGLSEEIMANALGQSTNGNTS